MQKDEMEKAISEILAKAERREKKMDTEVLIANVKSAILKQVGEMLATYIVIDVMANKASDQSVGTANKMKHTAFLIAEAAEMIMRRSWID